MNKRQQASEAKARVLAKEIVIDQARLLKKHKELEKIRSRYQRDGDPFKYHMTAYQLAKAAKDRPGMLTHEHAIIALGGQIAQAARHSSATPAKIAANLDKFYRRTGTNELFYP